VKKSLEIQAFYFGHVAEYYGLSPEVGTFLERFSGTFFRGIEMGTPAGGGFAWTVPS
jgi:hypothetical protein